MSQIADLTTIKINYAIRCYALGTFGQFRIDHYWRVGAILRGVPSKTLWLRSQEGLDAGSQKVIATSSEMAWRRDMCSAA